MRANAIHTEQHGNYEIRIYCDPDPDCNPRDWENLGTMTFWHPKYKIGDFNLYRTSETPAAWFAGLPRGTIALPVWLYDHSGISISTSNSYPYNDQWDAGQVGWIWVDPDRIRQEYKVKRISKRIRNLVLDVLRQEVKTYDTFLRGDVYGFEVYNIETEDCEDSCWGFVGEYEYCLEQARSMVTYLQERDRATA